MGKVGKEIDFGKVDFEKMSKRIELDIDLIKEILGILTPDVCNASTFEEAETAYNSAMSRPAEIGALKKWLEFTSTLADAKHVYGQLNNENDAKAALMKCIKLSSTAEDLIHVLGLTVEGSYEEAAAIRKLTTFYQK